MRAVAVSVIVPVFNGGPAFDECLGALVALEPPPADLIIVDDHSTDRSVEVAEARDLCVLKTSGRAGPASARNLGAQRATGDVLLFVDADVVAPVDLIARVRRVLEDDSVTAVIGCYDDAAPDPGFFTQYKNLYQRYVHQRARREAFTFWGACGAVRRTVFSELGGFDPDYARASIEDIEFGYRLRDAGHRIVLDKAIEVTHLKRWTFGRLLRSDILHRAVPWTALILRSGRMDSDLNLGWSHRLAVVSAITLAATVLLSPWWPEWPFAALICIGLLLTVDAPLAAYFARRRGVWFAVRALAWQWCHYVYSGLAFGLALTAYVLGHQRARSLRPRSNASVESV